MKTIKKYRYIFIFLMILPLVAGVSFKKVLDKTVKKRNKPIEYIVIHYTANLNAGADAEANAYYLRNKKQAGTHYCVDDLEIIQCTEEFNVAYAVGDRTWRGFIAKPWFGRKITNNNSLSFEMCLGGGRNDSLIMDMTAKSVGWQLVNKGLDISRVVRHHDVSGKHCPKFNYNQDWDQKKEDFAFGRFKEKVLHYQWLNLQKKNVNKQLNK